MRLVSLVRIFSLTFLLIFCQAIYAADTAAKPNDSEITSNIQTKLSEDKAIADVKVSSKSGVVSLSGDVATSSEASKAVEIAQSTHGVKEVNTKDLNVKETSSKSTLSDAMITAKVKGMFIQEKLLGDKDVSVMGVSVETNNGVVNLTGTVNNKEQAENAVKLAKSVHGVKKVESELKVEPAK